MVANSKVVIKKEIEKEIDKHRNILSQRMDGLKELRASILSYVNSPKFKGAAIDGSKNYLSNYYVTLLSALNNACDEMRGAGAKLRTNLSILKGDKIDVGQLEDIVAALKVRAKKFDEEADDYEYEKRTSTDPNRVIFLGKVIKALRKLAEDDRARAKKLQEVIDSVKEFEEKSGNLYDMTDRMFEKVVGMQRELDSIKWDRHQSYDTVMAGFKQWVNEIDELYDESYKKALELLNPDGEIDWYEVERLLQADIRDVTDIEIVVLSEAFLNLESDEEVIKFLSYGYQNAEIRPMDKNNDYEGNVLHYRSANFDRILKEIKDPVIMMAASTLWAEPHPRFEYDEEVMKQYVERLQLLQVLQVSDSQPIISYNDPGKELPIELSREEGKLNIRVLSRDKIVLTSQMVEEAFDGLDSEFLDFIATAQSINNKSLFNDVDSWALSKGGELLAKSIIEGSVSSIAGEMTSFGVGMLLNAAEQNYKSFLLNQFRLFAILCG